MSTTTTDPHALQREVWVHQEGFDTMRLFLEPHTKIIEDLKVLVLGESRCYYRAFYFQQHLMGDDDIPDDTSGYQPIKFKRIVADRRKYFFPNSFLEKCIVNQSVVVDLK
jgi:hypothetical protein